ncbi:sulfatase-like hydrolase/transferase [Sphingomonas gilva]|nr:sulfatase-like hydrolase/transferase [Sphingomonas gilva]
MTPALSRPAARWRLADLPQLHAWLTCWVILPNIGFWLLWIIAAPPRHVEILATGVIGLVVRRRSRRVQFAAFALALAYSMLSFIAGLFNLAVASLLASLRFAAELRPGVSVEYAVCAVGIAVILSLAWRALRRPTGFGSLPSTLIAAAAILAAAGLDFAVSRGMSGAYGRTAADSLFDSAINASGFADAADGKRDLILVVVESMGLPNDPTMRARLTTRWRQPDVAARYTLSEGAAPYFGSTTSGEIRELCGRWGDYYELVERSDAGCLPAQLAAKGYRTTAMHSFAGDFFARDAWYPNIGFGRMIFREALVERGAGVCPGVFPGACDRDVPTIMRAVLANDTQPQFVYWLTVNSHLPVPADAALRTGDCPATEIAAIRRFGMICRQFKLWDDIADALATQLVRPDFPDADILLVGDHMPPYFDRAQRSQFDPARVPWILLRRKREPSAATPLAAR